MPEPHYNTDFGPGSIVKSLYSNSAIKGSYTQEVEAVGTKPQLCYNHICAINDRIIMSYIKHNTIEVHLCSE